MSIRLGSQRRLGRPSAVVGGATMTASTVSVISRRQAANRCAGSRSLSTSPGPMTSLWLPSPSRARTMCVSSRASVSLSRCSWLAGRPNNPSPPSCRIVSSRSALARSMASSARGFAARARRVVRVGRGRVRPDRVQHHLFDAVGLDCRSSLAPVRADLASAVAAAVGVDHHPRPACPPSAALPGGPAAGQTRLGARAIPSAGARSNSA